MSIQTELRAALAPLFPGVPTGQPARVFPVVFPEEYKFEAGPGALFEIADSAIDGEGVSLCDALGLIPHKVMVGIVGLDYDVCWSLRNSALPLLAALQGATVTMAGRDGSYNETYRTFVIEIELEVRRALT